MSNGELNVVEYLIEVSGEDVNECNVSGYTPLHEASSRGDIDIVKYLVIDAKANIHAYFILTIFYLQYTESFLTRNLHTYRVFRTGPIWTTCDQNLSRFLLSILVSRQLITIRRSR